MKIKSVYDNGGRSADRFTIVFDVASRKLGPTMLWECVGSSMNPTHPQGFYQHSDCVLGNHLGKRIAFADLPEEVRLCVERELQEAAHDEH